MSQSTRSMIHSEVAMLREMLSDIPDDDVLERDGLEVRLETLEQQLTASPPEPRRLALTFRGAPVDRSHGMAGDFGGHALRLFAEAADSFIAADGSRSPQRSHALQVVDVAHGSFGFVLELPSGAGTGDMDNALGEAAESGVDQAIGLLQSAIDGDDDALSEAAAELPEKAWGRIHKFTAFVRSSNAEFSIRYGRRHVEAAGSVLRRAEESLRDEHFERTQLTVKGSVLGVLPRQRSFEAELEDGGIISGKLAPDLGDAAAFKAAWEGKPAKLLLQRTRVRRSARPC